MIENFKSRYAITIYINICIYALFIPSFCFHSTYNRRKHVEHEKTYKSSFADAFSFTSLIKSKYEY